MWYMLGKKTSEYCRHQTNSILNKKQPLKNTGFVQTWGSNLVIGKNYSYPFESLIDKALEKENFVLIQLWEAKRS